MFSQFSGLFVFGSILLLFICPPAFSDTFDSSDMRTETPPSILNGKLDTNESSIKEKKNVPFLEKGDEVAVCQSVKYLLLLKENKDLFNTIPSENGDLSDGRHVQGQFFIPKDNTAVTYPEWNDVSFEDLEGVYEQEIYHIISKLSKFKKIPAEDVIRKIERARLSNSHRTDEYILYRVYFVTGPQNILFINGVSARFYSDNFDQYFPFYYKSRLFWGAKPSNKRFFVTDLNSAVGKLRERVCTFSLEN